MVKTLDELLSSVDPALLHPNHAVKLLDAASDVELRAASLKTLLADRAADAGEWSRQGYHSPEDWLAHKTGTAYGQAAGTLNASAKLAELPELESAVRSGGLSGPKLNEVAKAATPENEKRLVGAAKTENVRDLKRTCAREKAQARSTEQEAARHERIHTERFHRSWTDDDGGHRYEGRTTAAVGARMDAAMSAEADRVFKEAYAQGRRESSAAYRADALVNLICGQDRHPRTRQLHVRAPRLWGDCPSRGAPLQG
jgi:hypothetical protein